MSESNDRQFEQDGIGDATPAARSVLDLSFERGLTIQPNRENGLVRPFYPYRDKRYSNRQLHRWGEGPFCVFKTDDMPKENGVYLLSNGQQILYAGYGATLRDRFKGYAKITGANCMRDNRPETTCRINHLIYEVYAASGSVDVLFHLTDLYVDLEAELIHQLGHPPWNRVCPKCGFRR